MQSRIGAALTAAGATIEREAGKFVSFFINEKKVEYASRNPILQCSQAKMNSSTLIVRVWSEKNQYMGPISRY